MYGEIVLTFRIVNFVLNIKMYLIRVFNIKLMKYTI